MPSRDIYKKHERNCCFGLQYCSPHRPSEFMFSFFFGGVMYLNKKINIIFVCKESLAYSINVEAFKKWKVARLHS